MNEDSFGEMVKARREKMEISQDQLAELSGVSQPTISRIEDDPLHNPTVNTKNKLLKDLELPESKGASYLDNLIIQHLHGMPDADKKTLLRVILRMKNVSESESAKIIKSAPKLSKKS